MSGTDVVVVGAGNAAMCAALAASESGARVTVLEAAPREQRGGNSAHSGGAFRVSYDTADDLLRIMPDLSESEIEMTDFGSYGRDQFFDDLARLSHYRADPDLAAVLVDESHETLAWLGRLGVRFLPIYGRQAVRSNGRFKFWGGLTVEASGGGRGLVDALHAAAELRSISVLYGARARSLVEGSGGVAGVRFAMDGEDRVIPASAVVLACGGFHANAEWRARYLGPNWDLVKVRGSRFNTGAGIEMALALGAMSHGHWSGCHSVAYERNAPPFGDIDLLGQQKNSFPFGIVVNARGERFFDEGADFRNYTYSNLGRAILAQPGGFAWQIFDARVAHLLTDEYRIRQITKVAADSIEGLADQLDGVDRAGFLRTIARYNDAVDVETPFDPAVKDGRAARAVEPVKSNWANRIDKPPFLAFAVACGITFTYGGIGIDPDGRVIAQAGDPIPGLYASGELVGGLYYDAYPGGAGLMSGAVFGRRAGANAARRAIGLRRCDAGL